MTPEQRFSLAAKRRQRVANRRNLLLLTMPLLGRERQNLPLGRILIFPYPIPAELLATFLGAPWFIWLLRRH